MKIGQTISNIRQERGMTQEEFASVFSVTRQTVSNWENEKSYPDLQTLVAMSDKFEVSLDSMLKEDVNMLKKIDRAGKINRRLKRCSLGLLVLVMVLASLCAGWTIKWHNTKQQMENKFQQGIGQLGFVLSDKEEDYNFPYILEEQEGVEFAVALPAMSAWYQLDYLGFYNQSVICKVQREDSFWEISWYGKDAGFPQISVYDREGQKTLTEQETKKQLRDDEQLKEVNQKAKEICQTLYEDYIPMLEY